MALWLLIGFGVTCVDQLAKSFILRQMQVGQSVAVIPGVFSITFVENTGAAFGILSDQTALLALVSAVVLGSVFLFRNKLSSMPRSMKVALAVALGGALGNFIDRVRLGYVVDFLHIERFPIFNIADMAIDIGVGLLLVFSLRQEGARGRHSD